MMAEADMHLIEDKTRIRSKKASKGIALGSLGRALNARERAFVREAAGRGLRGVSLKHAYIRAGYSPKSASGPRRLLNNPRVRHEIEQMERRKAAEAGVRLGAVLSATAKIAFANVADFVECDEDGRVKVNEEGQLQLRSDLTREDLEAISTITVNDRGRVSWNIDRGPAVKALRDLLHPTKSKVELTGANDAPLFDPTKLSDDDLASLIRILEGAVAESSGPGQGGGGSED
jgi:phage terminase small subunit